MTLSVQLHVGATVSLFPCSSILYSGLQLSRDLSAYMISKAEAEVNANFLARLSRALRLIRQCEFDMIPETTQTKNICYWRASDAHAKPVNAMLKLELRHGGEANVVKLMKVSGQGRTVVVGRSIL